MLSWLKKTKYQKSIFSPSALNLKVIPCNGDSCETLDMFYIKYVLPKGAFMSKTVATFVQKVGLIWLKVSFYLSYSEHKGNCWLKIVNHWDERDSVMCTVKEIKSGLKLL